MRVSSAILRGVRLFLYAVLVALVGLCAWMGVDLGCDIIAALWPSLLLFLLLVLVAFFPGLGWRRADELPAAKTDLVRRRKVWDVLSELYLDTELDEHDHERIAAVLATSGYSRGQLEAILYRELHPVLRWNLFNVLGESEAFDQKVLEELILRQKPRRLRFSVILGKWLVRGDWAAIEAKLRSIRGA